MEGGREGREGGSHPQNNILQYYTIIIEVSVQKYTFLIVIVFLRNTDQVIHHIVTPFINNPPLARAKGQTDHTHLHVRESPEGREERHGLARARRTTEDERLVLGQPGVEEGLVTSSVQCGDHHIRGPNLVGFHLYLGHPVHPRRPLPLNGDLDTRRSKGHMTNVMMGYLF